MLNERHLTVIDGDARIADTHVQQVLGYGRINDLHRIIRKHEEELESYGGVLCRSGKASSGQNVLTYFLTEAQATLVCMFARTPRAAEARRLIVEVFTRWRRGEVVVPPKVDPFKAHRERVTDVAEALRQLGGMTSLAAQVTYNHDWNFESGGATTEITAEFGADDEGNGTP